MCPRPVGFAAIASVLCLMVPLGSSTHAATASDAATDIASGGQAVTRAVASGTLRIVLPPDRMQALGFEVAEVRTDQDGGDRSSRGYRFDLPVAHDLRLITRGDEFVGLAGPTRTPISGGLAIRTRHPHTGEALAPGFLYDATLELRSAGSASNATPDTHLGLAMHASDPATGVMLRADGTAHWDAATGELRLTQATLTVGEGWATALGQPELQGIELGEVELVLQTRPVMGTSMPVSSRPRGALLDVKLGELYGLVQQGHIGTFPNGTAGLSAATTSCNVGDVDVPWFGPMDERHPLIALAMYREENGRLEMIGKNWIKHGFFSLNDSDCTSCPNGAGGNVLRVDCSDTYSAGNNGSQYYLGPRAEVNPHTAAWSACGSFFDEPTSPDGDCSRDYFGAEPDGVSHRLTVSDADLNRPGATFYYEGLYIVADDDYLPNNVGWRRISSASWNGASWSLPTFNEDPLNPQDSNLGALVMTWGDQKERFNVASDDGLAMLAVSTTELGDGWWAYDYALYNRTSARAVHSLSIPTGSASVRNLEFRDIDADAGNDWTIATTGNAVTWSTDDWSTDPGANALEYQTLYNLRFEADQAPAGASAIGGIFRPGVGTSFTAPTLAPGGAVDVPEWRVAPGLRLALRGANPATSRFVLEMEMPGSGLASLTVRDVAGRRVRDLLQGTVGAGTFTVSWDGRDSAGSPVASGVYFFRLQTESGTRTVKGTLLR